MKRFRLVVVCRVAAVLGLCFVSFGEARGGRFRTLIATRFAVVIAEDSVSEGKVEIPSGSPVDENEPIEDWSECPDGVCPADQEPEDNYTRRWFRRKR